MIRNEFLEMFILGFGLEIPNNGLGRPTSITQLWVAAKEECCECDMDEVLDALYNLQRDHAELCKYVPVGGGFQPVNFERVRNTPKWQDFFTVGYFNIKVLPPARLRFQRFHEKMHAELPLVELPHRPIGFQHLNCSEETKSVRR